MARAVPRTGDAARGNSALHERVEVGSRQELRDWLTANHHRGESIWLVTFKKPDVRWLPYGDIVEECLCFGWVDSLPRKLDARRTMLRLSPRKPSSAWSRLNKERVERLTAAGQMAEPGLRAVAEAKQKGTWSKLDAVEDLEVPTDLATALARYDGATALFHGFPRSAKRGILEWIEQAKRPETRKKRIEETARLAGQGKRANQWRGG